MESNHEVSLLFRSFPKNFMPENNYQQLFFRALPTELFLKNQKIGLEPMTPRLQVDVIVKYRIRPEIIFILIKLLKK